MVTILMKGSSGAAVRAMCQALATALGRDATDFPQLARSEVITADTEAAIRRWQAGVGVVADGIVGPRCQAMLGLLPPPKLDLALGTNEASALFPATKPANVSRYLPYVVAAMAAAGLKDGPMVLAALGTIRAETEGFLPISEYRSQFNTDTGAAPFNRYEPGTAVGKKLGNTVAGDGARFCGRGFVQLTGRYNYQRHGSALELDLTATPDLANAPEIAAALLAEFLRHCAVAMRAALAAGRYAAARKLVNGGSHGLDRFKDVFLRAKARPALAAGLPGLAGGRRGQRRAASHLATTLAARPATQRRPLTARRDAPDLRDRRYQPPPVSLLAEFPPEKDVRSFLPRYSAAGMILD